MNENLKNLYNTLVSNGYNPPAFDQFVKDMQDEKNLRGVYSTLQKEGYTPPAFDTFKSDMGITSAYSSSSTTKQNTLVSPTVKPLGGGIASLLKNSGAAEAAEGVNADAPSYSDPHAVSSWLANIRGQAAHSTRNFNERSANLLEHAKKDPLGRNTVKSGFKYNQKTGDFEQTYVTPYGTRHTNKAEADEVSRQWRDANDHSIEKQIGEAYREQERLEREIEARGKEIEQGESAVGRAIRRGVSGAIAGSLGGAVGKIVDYITNPSDYIYKRTDETYNQLVAASNANKERIKTLEAARDKGGFWRSAINATIDPNTWLFGIPGLVDAATLYTTSKKLEKNSGDAYKLTESEKSMLDNVIANSNVQGEYGDDLGFMYRAGAVTANALPFVAEFAVTGGFSGLANAGARIGEKLAAKAATKGITGKASQWLIKNTGVAAGDIASSIAMANTTGAARTASDILGRHMGDATIDEQGNYTFKGGEDLATAAAKGVVSNTLEYYTEKLGGHLQLGKWLSKGAEKVGLSKLSKAINYASSNKWLEKGGVQDYPSEVLEEEANIVLNALLVGDNKFSDLWDAKTQADIWGGMAFSIGFMNAPKYANTGYQAAQYYRYKHKTDKSDAAASRQIGADEWQELKEKIDGADNEHISDILNSEIIGNDDLSTESRKAAMDYAKNLLEMRGYNMGLLNSVKDDIGDKEEDGNKVVDTSVGSSYSEGYNAADETEAATFEMEYGAARENAEQAFDEETLALLDDNPVYTLSALRSSEEFTDEALAIAVDYVNAKAARDGAEQRMADDLDSEIDAARGEVTQRINGDDFMIHGAQMKADNADGTPKRVHIISGNVSMREDGSVDATKSSQTIVVRDAATGKVEMVSPEHIRSVEEAIDPQEEYSNAEAAARAVYEEKKARIQASAEAEEETEEEDAAEEDDKTDKPDIPVETEVSVGTGVQGSNASALSRVPIDEQSGEPMFERADRETALDALMEMTGGSEDNTREVVNAQLSQARKALEDLKKKQPVKKATTLKGSPMQMIKAQQKAEEDYNAEMASHAQQVAAAEESVNAWTGIYTLMNERGREAREKAEAERKEREAAANAAAAAQAQTEYEARKKAEEERKAIGNENPMPAITEKWENAAKIEGGSDEIVLPNGETVKGHYVLHESGAASASHNPSTWEKTEGFPMDANDNSVNDRDYEQDKDAQRVTLDIANNYDQRAIQTPIVVSSDGVVLSGNGRTMAGELAAQNNTDGAYIAYLQEHAGKYGFTKEQVMEMQHPRVSFVPDVKMPYTAETFAKFNQQEMKSQNKTEQAVKLGKTVSDSIFKKIVKTIMGFDTLGEFYADPEASLGAVYDLYNSGVIPKAQLAEMVDGARGNERLSAIGREMLENMLIGKAFGGYPDAVRMLTEVPSMRQSVITALGEISDNIALGGGYSLSDALADAVKLCYDARRGGAKFGEAVSPYSRIGLLFADPDQLQTVADFNNATMLMLADVLNDSRVTMLKTTLQIYNDSARKSAAGQGDLFAGGIKSKEDTLKDVINFINNNYGRNKKIEEARAAALERRKAEGIQQDGDTEAGGGGSENAGGGARSSEEAASLTHDEAIEIIAKMEERAEIAQDVALTIENWDKLFAGGKVYTPLGEVKMGENQFTKLMRQGRNGKLGMVKPTLENPDVVIEDTSDAKEGDVAERGSSYVFIKAFKKADGSRFYYFTSVTVSKDGKEVVISNQEKRKNAIAHLLSNGKLVWKHADDVSAASDVEQGLYSPQGKMSDPATEGTDAPQTNIVSAGKVTEKENSVQTSITNAEQETETDPSEAQKKAGNYKKGHVKIDGFDVTIENPKGSVRRGVDADGEKWEQTMNNTYGYIRGTEGVDGDHIDVFLSDDPSQGDVFVVDQVNKDGTFDEHKVMYGFADEESARRAYLANYEEGWQGLGAITRVSKEEFKKWVDSSHRKTKPFAEYKGVKKAESTGEAEASNSTRSAFDNLKKQASDRMLIFKEGDNYEILYEDAKKAAEILELPVQKKDGKTFVFFPIKDLDKNLPLLIRGGVMVAITDELVNTKNQKASETEATGVTDSRQVGDQDAAPYTITPAQYTTKKGKALDMHLVKFAGTLTKEQQRAAKELAKAEKGWYDREQGGFMMRSEESAKQLADTILNNEDAVSDAQPVSLADTRKIVEAEQQVQPTKPSGNRLVTDERYAELRERMRKKLGGQMNIGIDPEILAIGTEMAVYHLEKGARKFTEYAKAMIADLGDAIRPYLKSFYNGARNLPEVEGSEIAADMTPYDEVQQFNVATFDKEHSNLFTTIEIVAAEQAHQKEAEQAKREIINQRNTERRNKDEQASESTEAIANQAEAVADKAESGSEAKKSKKKSVNLQQSGGLELFDSLFDNETNNEDGLQRNDAIRSEGVPANGNRHEQGLSRGYETGSESERQGSRGTDNKRETTGDAVDRAVRPRLSDTVTEPKNTRNNHSERGKDHAPTSVDARIEANIKAIELAKQLLESGEQATEKQMQTLRKFSGWGGLGKAFSEGTYYAPNNIAKRLRELLGEAAYQEAVMSANSAYYTPAYVVDTLWDIAEQMGFKGGNILEGSAGIGNILGQMPTHISERSDIHAIEIDGTSGGILSLLYPDAKVEIQGFEETRIANGSVDLAITNVPFVTGLRVNDTTGDKDLSKKFHNIHDFCIAKNVRKLREGGLGIFITSNGTLDNSKKLRDWIVNEGGSDFVGAFRMHNKTFGGTGVTSDIIVIRKRVNGKKSANAIDVSTISGERMAEYDTGETRKVKGQTVPVVKQLSMDYNQYFIEHPENMAGEMHFGFEKGDMFRPTSKGLYPKQDKKQEQMLAEFVQSFAAEEFGERATDEIEVIDAMPGKKIGEVFANDGKLYINAIGAAQPLEVNANKVKGHTKVECFEAYSAIKEALAEVLAYQTENEIDDGLQALLNNLNKAYDDFVATYGHFNKNTAIAFLRNDVDYANVASVENYEEIGDGKGGIKQTFSKADVMKGRVVEKEKEPAPTNVRDGIVASIFKYGRIDIPYISEQLGKSEAEVKAEIIESGYCFEDPATRQVEVSYQYLSGNVREKLRQAQENNENGEFDRNIKALQEVIPMTIPAHLIDFTLGSSWIEPKLYEDYVKERTDVGVQFTAVGGTWFMNEPYLTNYEKNRAMGVTSEMLGRTVMGHTLIEAAIQNKSITVSTTKKNWDGSTETITDKDATQACAVKIDEIRQDFKEWARQKMQSDAEMSERMERIYNDTFNNYVPMRIPDDFVPEYFGGASHKFKMRPHQGRAIVRGTMQPLLLAHEVGTGKTFTLISTAMEMRRLGTARKPMIVVQNATVGQFVASAKELYPNAKILTLEEADRSAEGRKNFYAKIRFNDWDMIVVPQSTFEFIPDSEERQMAFIQEKIEEKMLVLEKMKEADPDGKSMITRQAEREIALLEEELAGLSGETGKKRTANDEKKRAVALQNAEVKAMEMLDRRTDDVENFDDMGIDALLIDEAHEYKHLGFATAMQRGVKGVDPSYSKKSQGVFLKTQAVLEKNNGRNVIFATGTPISNTAAEIWTFMRYLMPADTMKEYGIYYFDDFVRNFGNIQQMLEFTTSGKFKENNRFAGYVNLPELVRIWSGVSDTVLTKEADDVSDKIPDMEGGKAQDLYLPQTRALRSIMKFVKAQLEEYDKMSGKEKKENSHIPLTMYGIAKAAAVDARLVQSDAEDDANSKTNEAVRQTLRSLQETAEYKGTVAIFADNYQNKESGFNLYEDIRAKLIAEGIPANEIVVMKSGMTVKKKLEIFEKVNRGEVRVILGSTFTLGTGVNIQERLHTLIHLDAPNRPMDYTQRNGRILRQGNLHKAMGKPVRILRFGVEDSLDVTAYQRLKTKGAIADSIMNGKQMMANSMTNRVLEEEEDVFGDTVAQLSGSEYAMLKNNAEKNIRKYASRKKQWEADQTYIHNAKPRVKALINDAEKRIEDNSRYLEAVRTSFPDGKLKEIVIGKHRFTTIDAMEDFFKEHNKSLLAEMKQMKDGGGVGEQKRQLTIQIGDFSFVVTTKLTRRTAREGATLFNDVERKMTYSCAELGIEDTPVRQNLLRNAIDDITNNVITGRDFSERLEAAERSKKHNEAELEQLLSREGKPFEYEKELEQAKAQYEEYAELMKKELEQKEAKYAEMDADVETAGNISNADEDDEVFRDGSGAYTDDKVSMENDPWSKMAGYNIRSKKERMAFAERERRRMVAAVTELAERLGIADDVEIVTDLSGLQGRQRRAKGVYRKSSGKITIYIPNHLNVADAVATFLHEAVAHKGLRNLFGKHFDEFLDKVYANSNSEIRSAVDALARKKKLSTRTATEEYLAGLAEKTDFEHLPYNGWLQRVKTFFIEMLSKIGIHALDKTTLTDNELRFILWRSYRYMQGKDKGIIAFVEDTDMKMKLGVGYSDKVIAEGAAEANEEEATESIDEVNKRFNDAIDGLTEENKDRITLSLGMPSPILIAAGVENKPLKLYGNKVIKKMKKHGFTLDELKDLPRAVADPIAVFDNYQLDGNRTILTELQSKGKNIMVAVTLGKDGVDVDFNIISSIFGKGENNIVDWLNKGYARYINKEKALDYLHHSDRNISEALRNPKLVSAAKIVENFENPKIEGENSEEELFRDGEEEVPDDMENADETDGGKKKSDTKALRDILMFGNLSLTERTTAAKLLYSNIQNWDKKRKADAVKAIGENIADLAKVMRLQRDFDKATVKRVHDLACVLMESGYLSDLKEQEIKRLLAAVKNSVGKEDIDASVQKVMDIMIDNMLRRGKAALSAIESVRGSKTDTRGVEVQGMLGVDGQTIVKAFKEAKKIVNPCAGKTEGENGENTAWGAAFESVYSRMDSKDQAVADEASLEYAGMQMAQQWYDEIAKSKLEEETIRLELKEEHDKKSAEERRTDSYREFAASMEEAIRQNKIERAQAYFNLAGRLSDSLRGSVENALAFKEAEKQRIGEIHHAANSDMQGRSAKEHQMPSGTRKALNNLLGNSLFAPLATYMEMLRLFGAKSVNGEGYLFNLFGRGWIDARQKEIRGVRGKLELLDAKAKEVFGGKVKTWGDLIRAVGKLPKGKVSFFNGGEMQETELPQGNLMYIYMVNKMLDGKMKLRKMGISEEDASQIEAAIDPRLKEIADWLQEDFLVKARNEYNKTHKRMFGASMAAVENYFPLRILNNALDVKADELDQPKVTDGISTITGSIIKRRRNSKPLDILNADALHVILGHVSQMEHWNAYAEFNRDLNTLRSYRRFRNQVQNMETIYGNGKNLWNKFNDVCQMAAGVYKPKGDEAEKAALAVAQGVTAAAVSFRLYTALKQFASLPAFIPYTRAYYLAKAMMRPDKSWEWCMENLPIFEERWKSRVSGDPRLVKSFLTAADWRRNLAANCARAGMAPNAFIDALTCSMGAYAVYNTRKKQYLKDGYSEEQAERKAIQDAEMVYNETQQSGEDAFTSTMQRDRTWWKSLFTIFRNSSMAYQRQLHGALRDFGNVMSGGVDERVAFVTKQLLREKGIQPNENGEWSEADYKREEAIAKRKVRRQFVKDGLSVATFGYIMQLAWNISGYLPYLLFGDDDETKDEFWDDIWTHTFGGWLEGFTGGDVMSLAIGMLLNGEYDSWKLKKEMPVTSATYDAIGHLLKGDFGAFVSNSTNLLIQMSTGVNPQSLTDGALAIMDACGGDPALANEAVICVSRILSVPQSQIDELYFDEVGLRGDEVSKYTPAQLAERYALYKVKRGRFFAPWSWDDEELIEKQEKKANTAIKERLGHAEFTEVTEAYERYEKIAKEIGEQVNALKKAEGDGSIKQDEGKKRMDAIKQDKNFNTYALFTNLDKVLEAMSKRYMAAKSPEEAAMYAEAIERYRLAMLDALSADNYAELIEAISRAREINVRTQEEWRNKYKK